MNRYWQDLGSILERKDVVKYSLLAVLMIVSSFLQAVVVSSVPLFFSTILSGENALKLFKLPLSLKTQGDTQSVSLMLFGLVVASSGMSLFTLYLGQAMTININPAISSRLLKTYLHQPHEWHLSKNSAALAKRVLTDVTAVLGGVVSNLTQIFAKSFDIIILFGVLFWAKPVVAVSAFLGLGAVYTILLLIGRHHVARAGAVAFEANQTRFVSAREALSHSKLLKIYQCEPYFLDRYRTAADELAREKMKIAYFSLLPKPLLELCLYGGIFLGVAALTARGWRVEAIVPLLALYGAAAIRVLPAAQQLYYSFTSIQSNKHVLRRISEDFRLINQDPPKGGKIENADTIKFDAIGFTYAGAQEKALKRVDLEILPGEKVAFVGSTGAGKSTVIDLLLRLLHPTQGTLGLPFKDGTRVSDNVGYVPQVISFTDDTIANNVAFGVAEDKIDRERLKRACERAQAWDFIEEIPQGLDYQLGEGAGRLSGGQRQRIGIARALYFSPQVLVLDEASSALDADTERRVFEALFQEESLTLVVIGHRLSVLKQCDKLFLLREGKLDAQGTFDELLESNEYFRSLLEQSP